MAKKKSKKKNMQVSHEMCGHPLMMSADIPAAQIARFSFEINAVANPLGEVFVRGDELKRHKAVRRVATFERLYRSRVYDRSVFVALEWYDVFYALSCSGMYKCGLATSNSGGGTALSHTPIVEAAAFARSEIEWARRSIPCDLLPAFDAVMHDDMSFSEAARHIYPQMSHDRASRKVATSFKLAANYLMVGVQARIGRCE